jgi:hypothetical protein
MSRIPQNPITAPVLLENNESNVACIKHPLGEMANWSLASKMLKAISISFGRFQ